MLNNYLRVEAYTHLGSGVTELFFAVFKILEMLAGSLLAGEGVPIGRSLCNIPDTGYHDQLAAERAPRSRYTHHRRG